ncbi:hypothetical protein BDK51DRAFT_48136, partial [Blyttiomyces helicus]
MGVGYTVLKDRKIPTLATEPLACLLNARDPVRVDDDSVQTCSRPGQAPPLASLDSRFHTPSDLRPFLWNRPANMDQPEFRERYQPDKARPLGKGPLALIYPSTATPPTATQLAVKVTELENNHGMVFPLAASSREIAIHNRTRRQTQCRAVIVDLTCRGAPLAHRSFTLRVWPHACCQTRALQVCRFKAHYGARSAQARAQERAWAVARAPHVGDDRRRHARTGPSDTDQCTPCEIGHAGVGA